MKKIVVGLIFTLILVGCSSVEDDNKMEKDVLKDKILYEVVNPDVKYEGDYFESDVVKFEPVINEKIETLSVYNLKTSEQVSIVLEDKHYKLTDLLNSKQFNEKESSKDFAFDYSVDYNGFEYFIYIDKSNFTGLIKKGDSVLTLESEEGIQILNLIENGF